jgi:hypothetical protein
MISMISRRVGTLRFSADEREKRGNRQRCEGDAFKPRVSPAVSRDESPGFEPRQSRSIDLSILSIDQYYRMAIRMACIYFHTIIKGINFDIKSKFMVYSVSKINPRAR